MVKLKKDIGLGYDIKGKADGDTCFRYNGCEEDGLVNVTCLRCNNAGLSWRHGHGSNALKQHISRAENHRLTDRVTLGPLRKKGQCQQTICIRQTSNPNSALTLTREKGQCQQVISIVKLEDGTADRLLDLEAKSFKTIIGGTVNNNNKERRQGDIKQKNSAFKTVEKVLKKHIATQLREKKYADIKLLKPQFIKRETKKEKRSRDIDGGVQGLHNDQDFTKDEQFDPKAFSFWAPLQKSALVDFLVHPDPNPENEDSSIFQRLTVQIPVGYGVLHGTAAPTTSKFAFKKLADRKLFFAVVVRRKVCRAVSHITV